MACLLLIKDMFETITLYQNKIVSTESKKLENGKYQVDIEFKVSKYRNDEKGKIFYGNEERDSISFKTEEMKKPEYSVFLSDYVDVGIFVYDSCVPALSSKWVTLIKPNLNNSSYKVICLLLIYTCLLFMTNGMHSTETTNIP